MHNSILHIFNDFFMNYKIKSGKLYSSCFLMIILSAFLGEIYVAFFNLNPERTVISAKISDMAKVLPGKNFNGNSCQCKEVWSGNDIKVRKQTISRGVKAHGCALFVLKCKLAGLI